MCRQAPGVSVCFGAMVPPNGGPRWLPTAQRLAPVPLPAPPTPHTPPTRVEAHGGVGSVVVRVDVVPALVPRRAKGVQLARQQQGKGAEQRLQRLLPAAAAGGRRLCAPEAVRDVVVLVVLVRAGVVPAAWGQALEDAQRPLGHEVGQQVGHPHQAVRILHQLQDVEFLHPFLNLGVAVEPGQGPLGLVCWARLQSTPLGCPHAFPHNPEGSLELQFAGDGAHACAIHGRRAAQRARRLVKVHRSPLTPAAPPSLPACCRGRGSGAVLPAWMTSGGGGAAPGSGGGGGGAPPPPPQAPTAPGGGDGIGVEGLQHITSIEQALAILEEHSKVVRLQAVEIHCWPRLLIRRRCLCALPPLSPRPALCRPLAVEEEQTQA